MTRKEEIREYALKEKERLSKHDEYGLYLISLILELATAPESAPVEYNELPEKEFYEVSNESWRVFSLKTTKYKADLVSFQHGFELGYQFGKRGRTEGDLGVKN